MWHSVWHSVWRNVQLSVSDECMAIDTIKQILQCVTRSYDIVLYLDAIKVITASGRAWEMYVSMYVCMCNVQHNTTSAIQLHTSSSLYSRKLYFNHEFHLVLAHILSCTHNVLLKV